MTGRLAVGCSVLGAVFPVWNFGRTKHQILALGLALRGQPAAAIATNLLRLVPDPTYPRTFWHGPVAMKRAQQYDSELQHDYFKFQALPEYPLDEMSFESESLAAWLQGKRNKSAALLERHQDQRPSWLSAPQRNTVIMVTDERLTAHQQWTVEFEKRVAIPYGETVYLLPRKKLRQVTLPPGDFAIWDNRRVNINGYANGHLTHLTTYDSSEGNRLDDFLELKKQIIRLAQTQGQKIRV
jgi:hypothetical protein